MRNFIIVYLTLLSWIHAEEFYLKKEHSLVKPYSGVWETYGTAVITGEHVRLTHNHQSQVGGIVNQYPNTVRDFEIHLDFKVHGNDGTLFGDGLAFWYTEKPISPGTVFGSYNKFRGLAVFLDTYSNHNGPHHHDHPYISAMVNNGSLSYDHDTDGTHTQVAGCSAQFRNKKHETVIAIRYQKNKLTISHDIDDKGHWKECFAADNVHLPLGYYFGLSAATGELADNHDIISMKLYELDTDRSGEDASIDLYKIEPYAERSEPQREHVEDEAPSGIWIVFKWMFYTILFIVFVICAIFGVYYYQKQQESRKRLY